jgi:hypothetical protein
VYLLVNTITWASSEHIDTINIDVPQFTGHESLGEQPWKSLNLTNGQTSYNYKKQAPYLEATSCSASQKIPLNL